MEILLLLTWIIIAFITSAAAGARGRNPWGWLVIGLLLGIFGLILVLVIGHAAPEPHRPARPQAWIDRQTGYSHDPLETPRNAPAPRSAAGAVLEIYKGYQIRACGPFVSAGGETHKHTAAARAWIDARDSDT